MTNQEKYKDKTPLELENLFREFCSKQEDCYYCEFFQNINLCITQWLMKNADEEENNEKL